MHSCIVKLPFRYGVQNRPFKYIQTSFDQSKTSSSKNIQSALTNGSPETLSDLLLIVKRNHICETQAGFVDSFRYKKTPIKEAL